MKKLGKMLKKLLIMYLIIYITLSSMSSCFARGYDAYCGQYASDWAKEYVEKYADKSSYSDGDLGTDEKGRAICRWTGGTAGSGTFYGCCTCFVQWIYQNALGINIYDYGFSPLSDTAYSNLKGGNEYFDDVSSETLQAGDILIVNGHAEMYAGDDQHANFGSTPMNVHGACNRMTPGRSSEGAIAVRLKSSVQVNPAGNIPVTEEEDLSIYDENGFIYSGVAKIKGYKSSTPFGKWIIEKLTEILDYIIGIMTIGIRMVIVGWTAIIERFFMDGIVNAVTGVTNERVDDWGKDPELEDEIDQEAQEIENQEDEEQTSQATGQPGDEDYISEGMQTIADIGGNVQLNTSSKANVTIENMVYNKIPILDINFFNFESAGGAVVDENGIIYIIKENVALWYYIFRVISIIIMLLVLIYLGIKMAISTVAEKKAVYKQMLVSWIAGFTLVFAVNYIMFFIIYANESAISWITPKYESGEEISLYESVRSKAYELKASTGFAGMIMYMILVYYSIRFLFIYFKRFLTVMMLALISPFMGVSYALQKINKNGRGAGEIYGNWIKDFSYTVFLQSLHALVYTIFISNALKLSETSLLGIFISFVFLVFMVRMDPLVRQIFGFAKGSNAAKLAMDPIAPKVKAAQALGKKAKKVAGAYGNVIGKVAGKPASKMSQYATRKINAARSSINQNLINSGMSPEELKKKQEEAKQKRAERKKKRDEVLEQTALGLKFGKDLSLAMLKGAMVVPMMIAEPALGVQILSSTISSGEKIKDTLKQAEKRGFRVGTAKGKYKFRGIQPRNQSSAQRLTSRLTSLGVDYKIEQGHTNQTANSRNRTTSSTGQRPTTGQRATTGQRPATGKGTATGQRPATSQSSTARRPETRQGPGVSPEIQSDIKTQISNLMLANNITGENIDPSRISEYMSVLQQAKQKEKEVETSYKELVGKLDEQIAEMEKVSPEFARELQRKKTEQVEKITQILSKPLAERDIYAAMQNYKSKVPSFNADSEYLQQRDIEGIAKEIDLILEQKGQDIRMSKEFVAKVQKEITENQRRMRDEKQRAESRSEIAGQDVSRKGINEAHDTTRSVTESVRTLSPDTARSADVTQRAKEREASVSQNTTGYRQPRSTSTAPQQNNTSARSAHDVEKSSSTDRLVKNIVNASRGTESKVSVTMPRQTIRFAKQLEELQKLGEQAEEISGEKTYNLDEILERLKNL